MTTTRTSTQTFNSSAFSSWINRGIEALWLLIIILVPVVFIDRDHIYSEAVIAFVEVPKIALIRTLTGLMAMLWLLEWGIGGNFPLVTWLRNAEVRTKPSAYVSHVRDWLMGKPTRWLVFAVWFFLFTTLISTVFSTSFNVSLWGEVPGQDGLSTYTMASYLLLFGVITTHLKTRPQLWRLLSAVTLVGVLVSGYAVMQHYGYDPLGAVESTGGGTARVTSTVGNAVFAGAAMLIPISISFLLATLTLQKISAHGESRKRRWSAMANLFTLGSWTLVLTVQFLGIIFTFSRGPWLGTMLALLTFLILTLLAVGWRAFAWGTLVLSLAASLAWTVLQWSGTGPITGIGFWLVIPLILAVVGTLPAVFRNSSFWGSAAQRIQSLFVRIRLAGSVKARLISVLLFGVVATSGMALAVYVALPSSDAGPMENGSEPGSPVNPPDSTITDVTARFASVSGEVLSGGIANRAGIWNGSLILMRDHPWFGFEDLSLSWLRPLVGYGPDMFRYTYLLVSVPLDSGLLPAEPDHAHNFFLNQGIEQGFLGLLSSIGLFLAVFWVGGYQLLKRSGTYSEIHKLVLIGLVATITGRFLEQMVGVTRVSDLMLFWVILAVLAALPTVMQSYVGGAEAQPIQQPDPARAQRRRTSRLVPGRSSLDMSVFWRLAIIAWAVGGILALTWVKSISYPRAAIAGSEAIAHFNQGNFQEALSSLDTANRLAPDVTTYYSAKASVYNAYLRNRQRPPEPQCSLELNDIPYADCLVLNIHFNNILGSEQRPYYWRSRLSRADSALALGLEDEAIRLYREVVQLVPGGWLLYNRLAEAYIDIGQPESALEVLDDSLAITKDSYLSDHAVSLQKLALDNIKTSSGSQPTSQNN